MTLCILVLKLGSQINYKMDKTHIHLELKGNFQKHLDMNKPIQFHKELKSESTLRLITMSIETHAHSKVLSDTTISFF
jgi:hypothetical protein